MSITTAPWLLAAITGIWFGLLAWRAGRNWFPWALTGALFALMTTTFVFGLGQATAIPFSDGEKTADQLEWTLIAVALIAVLGSLFTLGLWRRRPAAPGAPPQSPAGQPSGTPQPATPEKKPGTPRV
ncbi:MAG: hypothetical protein EHM35_08705 [Planctomycetaceae bacterium]|nr:MAG: hypothetical protein EHM35_08705 [Planctomycetaceae bacterium]